jgi:hypothetical protein
LAKIGSTGLDDWVGPNSIWDILLRLDQSHERLKLCLSKSDRVLRGNNMVSTVGPLDRIITALFAEEEESRLLKRGRPGNFGWLSGYPRFPSKHQPYVQEVDIWEGKAEIQQGALIP